MRSYQLNVCEMQLSIRADADPERMERARQYVDECYGRMKANGGQVSRERLLVMLLISMADDLLLLKERSSMEDSAIEDILRRMEEKGFGIAPALFQAGMQP